jgi:large subunit ribosomal protein L31
MAKKNLHPEWYQTKIYCDGKLILEVGTTKKELFVDIWSGNHPFYTGSQKIIDAEGRVEKFQRKYNLNTIKELEEIAEREKIEK